MLLMDTQEVEPQLINHLAYQQEPISILKYTSVDLNGNIQANQKTVFIPYKINIT
jgi:hypothetical protein